MASSNLSSEQLLDGAPGAVAGVAWEARWREILLKVAGVCLLVYCAAGAVMLSVGSAKLIYSPMENSYPEGPSLYGAVRAAQTGRLYFPVAEVPYTPQPYGPLYYAMNAAIAKASHFDVDLVAVRSRMLVFGCFLLSGVFVALIARKLQFSNGSAVLAGLMLLGQPDFYPNNVSVRPDMLCLAGMLLCLLVALDGSARKWACAASGLLAGMAFLIKQSAVAAPVAIVAVLLLHRKFRQFAWFAASAAVPVLLALALLLWRKEPFYEHFASMGQAMWSTSSGAVWTKAWLSDIVIVIPLAIGAIGFGKAIGAGEGPQMIAAFAVASFGVALATVPQAGGSVNYFLPELAGCALLLPFAMRVVRENVRPLTALALVSIFLLWGTAAAVASERGAFLLPVQRQADRYATLRPYRILSDRTFFNLHGRDAQLLDPFLNHSMELAGHWDPSVIVAALHRGDYDLIILACIGGREVCNYRGVAYFGAPIVSAINANYDVLCATLGARVLKPSNREVSVTPAMLGPALGQACGTGMTGRPAGLVFAEGTR